MLFRWKRRDGSEATYRVLHAALCHKLVGLKDLAETFCCNQFKSSVFILYCQLYLSVPQFPLHIDMYKFRNRLASFNYRIAYEVFVTNVVG